MNWKSKQPNETSVPYNKLHQLLNLLQFMSYVFYGVHYFFILQFKLMFRFVILLHSINLIII